MNSRFRFLGRLCLRLSRWMKTDGLFTLAVFPSRFFRVCGLGIWSALKNSSARPVRCARPFCAIPRGTSNARQPISCRLGIMMLWCANGKCYHERREVMENAINEHELEIAGQGAYGGSSFWMRAPEDVDTSRLPTALMSGVLIEPAILISRRARPQEFLPAGLFLDSRSTDSRRCKPHRTARYRDIIS